MNLYVVRLWYLIAFSLKYGNFSQYPLLIAEESLIADLLSYLLNPNEWSTCENLKYIYIAVSTVLKIPKSKYSWQSRGSGTLDKVFACISIHN